MPVDVIVPASSGTVIVQPSTPGRVTVIEGGSSSGGGAAQNVFIQPTDPAISGPYLWIDTTGGNLQFLVEDGL